MKTVGIIVEYNPLHNGHVHHFNASLQAAGAEACVAVMSGHFLQRGEPAVVNKWARTEMALRMGADVVIELPVAYACQPAEWFAYGAVKLLDATGVVDALCFGSEEGTLAPLDRLAGLLCREDGAFRSLLQEELKQGASYPAAYAAAVRRFSGSGGGANGEPPPPLEQPNTILGLHYLLALKRLQSPIAPLTVVRREAGFHQADITAPSIASATALRKLLFRTGWQAPGADALGAIAPYVPPYTLEIMQREHGEGRGPLCWEHFAGPLFGQLLSRPEEELRQLHEVTEGLENRIKAALGRMPADASSPVEALLDLLKTKRYTRTKLQRTLLRILLGHTQQSLGRESLLAGPACIRVLGFSPRGRTLLKRMRQTAKLPVITRAAAAEDPAWLGMDIRAGAVYSLGYRRLDPGEWQRDYREPPLRLD
ncbi:nucleotidyltransferase [Paenibacillus sp. YN15]|uniref:nucleotidyltransferase n=1 Tax=Paenibacillus sp. YN15 TaxID=1742774 RepID=UPI000DCD6FCA|nr:nucleotidyltransferase [Paenibacillus sp. YN15]RAV04585.1 nucleotidyltransferase [Paenibacillus sp. YN15]